MDVLDYLVVGGGYAGMNVLGALKQAAPSAKVLCVDARDEPGGSWHSFYSFARLHSAFFDFGVLGEPWHLTDRSCPAFLASRKDVLIHFKTFVGRGLCPGFRFQGATRYLGCRRQVGGEGSGLLEVTLETGGKEATLQARHVIDARGFDYKVREGCKSAQSKATVEVCDDLNLINVCNQGAGVGVPEIELEELPQRAECPPGSPARLYVVIGGGKTGMDAVLWLADHKRQEDDVLLITGRTKYFLNRDHFWPANPQGVRLRDMALRMLSGWDGEKAEDAIKSIADDGFLHSVHGAARPSTGTMFAWVGSDEMHKVEQTARAVTNDHFQRCVQDGHQSTIFLRSGDIVETDKEVVLLNCRSSTARRENAFTHDVHPVRPDGSVNFGTLCGFTGPTHYLMTLLYIEGKLASIPLFGLRDLPGYDVDCNFSVAFMLKVLLNNLNISLRLSHWPKEAGFDPRAGILRELSFCTKLLWNRRSLKLKAKAHLRELKPEIEEPDDTTVTTVTNWLRQIYKPKTLLHLLVLLLGIVACVGSASPGTGKAAEGYLQ